MTSTRSPDAELQEIVLTHTLTPRKCLGFLTPLQALLQELGRDVRIRFAYPVALRSGIHLRLWTQNIIRVSLSNGDLGGPLRWEDWIAGKHDKLTYTSLAWKGSGFVLAFLSTLAVAGR